VKKPNWQFFSWAPGKSFPVAFEVKVDARQVVGPTGKYGIIWGKDGDNYYVFTISSDGRYRLQKQVNDVWQTNPVSWTNNSAIKRGTSSNQLKVNVIGNSITLIVNDTVLTTVNGSSFGPGKIGLVGGSFDYTGVEVQFDNLMIYDFSSLSTGKVDEIAKPPEEIDTQNTGAINLTSTPSGAKVFLDVGQYIGKTPLTIDGLNPSNWTHLVKNKTCYIIK